MKFVAVTGKNASPALFDIWDEQLHDIPSEKLGLACDHLMKTWRFPNLPTPGDVRSQIDEADAKGLELESAAAWERYLAHVQRYFYPDLGWDRRTPQLPAVVEHAARAAGGAHWVEGCSESELQWARKRFIDGYRLAHETGQVEHLLTRGDHRRILATITTGAPQVVKSLPVPAPIHSSVMTKAESSEPDAKMTLRTIPQPLSEEEIERRRRDVRQHPELAARTAHAAGAVTAT